MSVHRARRVAVLAEDDVPELLPALEELLSVLDQVNPHRHRQRDLEYLSGAAQRQQRMTEFEVAEQQAAATA
jgi:hypothetical protein